VNVEHVSIPEMPSFLERFSRGHEGWLTRVEVEDETRRGEIETDEQPLGGIVADRVRGQLLVFLENDNRGSNRYCIDRPTEICRETAGETVRLEVASADGSTTVVECHPAGH
jgi:Family of unknown function (DUF5335)